MWTAASVRGQAEGEVNDWRPQTDLGAGCVPRERLTLLTPGAMI